MRQVSTRWKNDLARFASALGMVLGEL